MAFTKVKMITTHVTTARGNSVFVFLFPFLCTYYLIFFSCMETISPFAQRIKSTPSLNPGT